MCDCVQGVAVADGYRLPPVFICRSGYKVQGTVILANEIVDMSSSHTVSERATCSEVSRTIG